MLGLQVNTYVGTGDYDDAANHRVLASKLDIMDIVDLLSPQPVRPIAVREEGMPDLDVSDDEAGPSSRREEADSEEEDAPNPSTGLFLLGAEEEEDERQRHVNVTPLAVPDARPSPFGTPTSRVGFPSTARPSRMADPEPEPAAEVEPAA